MRRLVVSVIVASGLVLTGAGTASAEQAPSAGAAQAAAGKKVCKVTDERLNELSGLVATEDGFVVINDSSSEDSRKRVFFLNDKCKVVNDVSYSGSGPRDTEDLALSPDGKTLWIADIGDNRAERPTIGLWSMPADGSKKPKIHRLAYPDGKHDAEALLLDGDGTPLIVTKELGKAAGVYTPTAPLKTENAEGVPMRKAGTITVPPSDTSGNTLARLGRGVIDGGAVSRDGSKVVLRTYTDALEWDVKGGDVAAALKGKPRVTPLPDEPFGEAISYSPDGRYFYTVSDMGELGADAENHILRYTPAAPAAVTKAAAAGGTGGGSGGPSWYDDLSITDITYLVGGVGVLGAILVGFGIFGIMRSRKRPPEDPSPGDGDGPEPTDAKTELLTVGGAAAGRGTGVYGGQRAASGPGVYGGKPGPPGKGGAGVYGAGGGRPAAGGQPGRPGGGGGQPGGGRQPGRPGTGGGQPVGRPGTGGGQPVGRPGAGGGQPAVRPGGQPAGRPGPVQPAGRPGAGQPAGRPGAGQPAARPGGQPSGRPGGGPPPVRPGGGGVQQPGRPAPGGQPQPQRPAGGGGGAQPGRGGGRPVPPAGGGGRPVPPAGGQPPTGRPGQGGGRPGNGVYGAPPQNPQGPNRNAAAGGPAQRPSGFFGQGGGHPDQGRPASNGMNH